MSGVMTAAEPVRPSDPKSTTMGDQPLNGGSVYIWDATHTHATLWQRFPPRVPAANKNRFNFSN